MLAGWELSIICHEYAILFVNILSCMEKKMDMSQWVDYMFDFCREET